MDRAAGPAHSTREPASARGEVVGDLGGQDRVLELVDVHRSFGDLHVIKGCSLGVRKDGVLALVGANGAGKTTIFNLISGVLKCDAGRILLHGRDITAHSSRRISRMGLGRTFQNLRVFESMTVYDNVLVSVENTFFRRGDRAGAHSTVSSALERVGLGGLESVQAKDLSYAEQKFLSIARVYARSPQVVLLDEPASGLDTESRERLVELIDSLRERGATIVLVEHNLEFVARVATEIAFLDFGIVRAQGAPADVMQRPELVEAYFGE